MTSQFTPTVSLYCLHGVSWMVSCFACGRYYSEATDMHTPATVGFGCPACIPGAYGQGANCPTNCQCRCHFPLSSTGAFPA